jgi:hypothetical protein
MALVTGDSADNQPDDEHDRSSSHEFSPATR